MVHLHHCLSLHINNHLHNPSILFFLNQPSSSASWRWHALKKSRRKVSFLVEAVERDSEYEVDQDKAREALRKLDQQFESLSKKQIDPPKIRATELNRASFQMKEETNDLSGSFFTSLAFGLLLFTIFYNILFITVIKPAIDGPETIAEIDLMLETLESVPLQQLLWISGALNEL